MRLLALVLCAGVVAAGCGEDDDRSVQPRAVVDPNGKPGKLPRKPHVIVIMFDEFTGDTLLGRDGRIDAARYPNFAGLAQNATWFPNAWSSYDSTPKAIPLILDGKKPILHNPPTRQGHPRSIYDMFAREGYRLVSSEESTAMCPPRLCPGARTTRPSTLQNLRGGRAERLERFFGRVRAGKPTFYMKHVLLPHDPQQYLPSGRRSRSGVRDLVPQMNGPLGFHDRFLMQHNYQRHLLQVRFVDLEIGKLLRRLVRLGLFDKTLIVLVADHGKALSQTGTRDRRKVNERNVDEVVNVPLFIKAPNQRRGRINRAYVQTMDITPTIADVLNYRLGYRADGSSAFSRRVRRRRMITLPTRSFDRIIRISARRYEARRRVNTRRRIRWFGAGLESMFRGIGPRRALLGKALGDIEMGRPSSVDARLAGGSRRYRVVRPSSGIVPTQIAGDIRGGRPGAKRNFAVAINGRIEATGRTWYLKGDRTEHFAVNVPEPALRAGRNTVELYEIDRSGTLHRL